MISDISQKEKIKTKIKTILDSLEFEDRIQIFDELNAEELKLRRVMFSHFMTKRNVMSLSIEQDQKQQQQQQQQQNYYSSTENSLPMLDQTKLETFSDDMRQLQNTFQHAITLLKQEQENEQRQQQENYNLKMEESEKEIANTTDSHTILNQNLNSEFFIAMHFYANDAVYSMKFDRFGSTPRKVLNDKDILNLYKNSKEKINNAKKNKSNRKEKKVFGANCKYTSKNLYKIPESNMLITIGREDESRVSYMRLFDTDNTVCLDRLKSECTSLKASINDKRKLIFALSNTAHSYYKILSYENKSLALVKKVPWSIPIKMTDKARLTLEEAIEANSIYPLADQQEDSCSLYAITANREGTLIATVDTQSIMRVSTIESNQELYSGYQSYQSMIEPSYYEMLNFSCEWTSCQNKLALMRGRATGITLFDIEKFSSSLYHFRPNKLSRLKISSEGTIAISSLDGQIFLFDERSGKLNSLCKTEVCSTTDRYDLVDNDIVFNDKNSNEIMIYSTKLLRVIDLRILKTIGLSNFSELSLQSCVFV